MSLCGAAPSASRLLTSRRRLATSPPPPLPPCPDSTLNTLNRKLKEGQEELTAKEIQLKAVTAQLAEMQIKVGWAVGWCNVVCG